MTSRNQKVREMKDAHERLMADLIKARDESLGETRALFRRAIDRLERLNQIANRGTEV